MLAAIVAVLLWKKLVCTAPSISSSGRDQNDATYCHTMSISRVGTKKDVGAEAIVIAGDFELFFSLFLSFIYSSYTYPFIILHTFHPEVKPEHKFTLL